jgi:hypothetical protein
VSDGHYDRVLGTFADLDVWGHRLAVVHLPEPGSDLAEDDEDWPVLPVSQIAVSGLAAARDHLQAVRIHIDARQLFPFAQASLIRTATLAAAQAVWVLAPDEREARIGNARTLTQHLYEEHLKFLRDLQALAASPHAGTDAVEGLVTQRLAELSAKRAADGQRSRFEATKTIEVAALATWGRPEMALEARVEWRRGSAAAHGLVWSVLGRPGTQQAGDADSGGVAAFEAGGSIEALANPYLCAHGLVAKGFSLLDARSVRP